MLITNGEDLDKFLMVTWQTVSLNIKNSLMKETAWLLFLLESTVLVNQDLVPVLLSYLHTYDTKHYICCKPSYYQEWWRKGKLWKSSDGVLPYCIKEEYTMSIHKTQASVLWFWGQEYEWCGVKICEEVSVLPVSLLT